MTASIEDIRHFWDSHPVGASAVPFLPGTPEFFDGYDRMREANESVSFARGFYEFQKYSGRRVIDIGCGNGYTLSRYAMEGADVYGVDITPTAIALAKARFSQMGLRGQFRIADLENLPFPTGYFDCLSCMGVLHHTVDPDRGIREFFRVLKPGGRLLMMVYHRNSALYRIKFPLLARLQGKSQQRLVNEVDGIGNPKGDVYTRHELRQLLQRFEAIELQVNLLQGWMLLPKGGSYIPNVILKPFSNSLGWFLYAKGLKPPRP